MIENGIKYSEDEKTLVEAIDKTMSNIVIPNSVTEIGEGAFEGCTSLESIDIPNSVITIGTAAFYGCTSLESIDIPNSVTKIDGDIFGAFEGCTSLKSIILPNTLTEIGEHTFFDCTSLESIDIPNSVITIGDAAFYGCTSLESIDIPNSVITIGDAAFDGCTSLKSIDIPNSVITIGDAAFRGCTSLESIDIPNSVTEIGKGIVIGKYGTFEGCTSLKRIGLPNALKEIKKRSFYGCTSLKNINIPNSVTKLGTFAFTLTSLQTLNLSASIIEIEEHAICNCPISNIIVDENNPIYFSKEDVLYKKVKDKNCLVKYSPKKKEEVFYVNEETKMLDCCAFKGARNLVKIVLHDNLLCLGTEGTFAFCESLKEICLPPSIDTIPPYSFSNCLSLERVVLPKSESYSIKSNSFEKCSSLKSIHSSAVKLENIIIDEHAFDGFNIDECTLYVPSGTRWSYRHHKGFGKFINIEIEDRD